MTRVAGLVLLNVAALIAAQTGSTSMTEQWRQVLRYGIDMQVLEVVGLLTAAEDTRLDDELEIVLSDSLNPHVRRAIIDHYRAVESKRGLEVAGAVVTGADTANTDLLLSTIRYLGDHGAREYVQALVSLIDDEEPLVATAAIGALGSSRSPDIDSELLERLDDANLRTEVRADLILALGELGSQRAVPRLQQIVANRASDRLWRFYAADALGKIGDPSSIPVLVPLLSEDDPLLKSYAVAGLGAFAEAGHVIGPLTQALRDSHWRVRVAAAEALGRAGPSEAVTALQFKTRHDPERPVRIAAAEALAIIGTPETISFLKSTVTDPEIRQQTRESALATLITHRLGASTAWLTELSASPDAKLGWVAGFVAGRLAELRKHGTAELITALLTASDPGTRLGAVRAVGASGFSPMRDVIAALSEQDPSAVVRQAAVIALERM